MRKLSAKDKFIGRTREEEDVKLTTFKEKRMEKAGSSYQNQMIQLNNQNMEEVTNILQNNSSYIPNEDLSLRSERFADEIESSNLLD